MAYAARSHLNENDFQAKSLATFESAMFHATKYCPITFRWVGTELRTELQMRANRFLLAMPRSVYKAFLYFPLCQLDSQTKGRFTRYLFLVLRSTSLPQLSTLLSACNTTSNVVFTSQLNRCYPWLSEKVLSLSLHSRLLDPLSLPISIF